MDMRDDSYMARYFDDLERELALVFEDIEDDGDRDDVVRQLQDYVMYQNSVLSMSPLACVKYYEAAEKGQIRTGLFYCEIVTMSRKKSQLYEQKLKQK